MYKFEIVTCDFIIEYESQSERQATPILTKRETAAAGIPREHNV